MNDRFKFRVWAKKSKRYTGNNASYSIDESGVLHVHTFGQHYELENTEDFEVEQCTGLKDKNGNLIYECDLLEAGGRRYVVCWAHHGFVMRFTPDSASSYPLGGTDLFEIIGNIHEQKDVE